MIKTSSNLSRISKIKDSTMDFKINNHLINVSDDKVKVMRIDGKVLTIILKIDGTTTFRDAIKRITNITELDTDTFVSLAIQAEHYYEITQPNNIVLYVKTFKALSHIYGIYSGALLIKECDYDAQKIWKII